MNKIITLNIQSLSHSGHGIGISSEIGEIYVLGAYPKDIIEVKIYKQSEGITYGEIVSIIEPSTDRSFTPTQSPFFSSNTPWEYLSIDAENNFKNDMVKNLYTKFINDTNYQSISFSNELETTHYRNKVAYSFMKNKKGLLTFALYTRGTHGVQKTEQKENILVHPLLEKIGKQFLDFFNQKQISVEQLKYLTLRYSYLENNVVAHILVPETNRKKLAFKKVNLESFLQQYKDIKGILVSHSEPGIRSSITTKDFYHVGDIDIIENILDKTYTYHPSLFFQIYPKAFSEILKDLRAQISKIKNANKYSTLDMFAGVGVIGLEIADMVSNISGVEISLLSKRYALENAKNNNIQNFTFQETSVDNILNYIKSEQILIVDPTRAGLSQQTIETIREKQPEYVFYISCNPETQFRDFSLLKDIYEINFIKPYNIFPKTHHVESMIVLKIK